MRKRLDDAKCSLVAVDKRTGELFASVKALKEERNTLRENVQKLEAVEKQFKAYKDREPEIKHYLGQFAGVARYV